MFNRLWTKLKDQLVADTPNEISACLDCGRVACGKTRFRNCPVRLSHARALDAHDSVRRSQTGGAPAED